MLDTDQRTVNSVAEGQRAESKFNERVTDALEFALETAVNPDVRYHLREAIMLQRAAEVRGGTTARTEQVGESRFPTCPECGARVTNLMTTGPGEHYAGPCGCRVDTYEIEEFQR